jgi:DNA-binding HxlR family transcriptional regulator
VIGGFEDEGFEPHGKSIHGPGLLEPIFRNAYFLTDEEGRVITAPPLPREHNLWTPLARALSATGDQWTLLIILQLATVPMRPSELRKYLPGISTGVLNRHLQHMVDLDLLARQRFRELPPRVEYKLTQSGQALLPIVTSLARWGMQYMWSDPQAYERVDIGAVLRLLPTLLPDNTRLPSGVVELVVERPGRPDRHVFNIDGGRMIEVGPAEMMPWTCIAGGALDWVDALGPSRKSTTLEVTGDKRLASAIIRALPRSA